VFLQYQCYAQCTNALRKWFEAKPSTLHQFISDIDFLRVKYCGVIFQVTWICIPFCKFSGLRYCKTGLKDDWKWFEGDWDIPHGDTGVPGFLQVKYWDVILQIHMKRKLECSCDTPISCKRTVEDVCQCFEVNLCSLHKDMPYSWPPR
jgi:hypothetical protein